MTWAGLSPPEIRKHFCEMARKGALTDLAGPFAGLHPNDLQKLRKEIKDVLTGIGSSRSSWLQYLPKALKIGKLMKRLSPHLSNRGLFRGELLEANIDELLRTKIKLPEKVLLESGRIRFGHVIELMKTEREAAYRPPLLLTTTNLTKRRLEIVSSIDYRYANVPIAKAVRASAGFPVFFTPQEMPECPDGGWFVDGGLVSNFPIWMFSDALRAEIQKSYLAEIYGHIVNRPWIRIGLRVVNDIRPERDLRDAATFFRSLAAMLSGGTRNELEEILASRAPRSLIVKQPYSETNGPPGVMDITALDADRVESMVSRGRDYANDYLKRTGSPGAISTATDLTTKIVAQLKALVERSVLVFNLPFDDLLFRANVFMPISVGDRHSMKLVFGYNMDSDGDRDMEFPDLQSGATGFCYWSRRPQVCNLKAIQRLRQNDPARHAQLFGMPPKLHGKVREDRSWLASVPIFDSYEVRFDTRGIRPESRHKGSWYCGFETEVDGPVLGVLNLDAGWDYEKIKLDEDPNHHFSDGRVQTLLAIMQAASFTLAASLSEDFPRMRED